MYDLTVRDYKVAGCWLQVYKVCRLAEWKFNLLI